MSGKRNGNRIEFGGGQDKAQNKEKVKLNLVLTLLKNFSFVGALSFAFSWRGTFNANPRFFAVFTKIFTIVIF